MIRYEKDEYLEKIVKCIIDSLEMNYIEKSNVYVVKSHNSKTKAIARIYSVPSAIRFALGMEPIYVIEFISEKFDRLSFEDKIKVIIHELLHIPSSFTGGLRPHGKIVNNRAVNNLFKKIDLKKCT
ncbi:putative metallopeptidase [Caldisphaera lagunensis DSM 15908]|uniref:Putative metallopeptidase n=1 Tax=Caldisphaera lagunensis (strain DSM 15908 / JCM 11604 / ANMR 0165 / IC-154) TaxID=1056495 RepID=L0A7V4_CALLD|nr:putative metallopeptidase [Caldisphaera lagunensis]AFZ69911.1 putative metallopeptidase [Caldisphaera lagunensis DSM 15908]